MSRIGIIAAAGRSSRTGLGDYTSKAALPLLGRPLLAHQIEFLRRSDVDRILVVAQPQHARLFASLLSDADRKLVAFLYSESAGGWAGKLEHAGAFIDMNDEVVIVPCDNYQTAESAEHLGGRDVLFTYTERKPGDLTPPTDGPVFGYLGGWKQMPGRGFVGNLFTGYIVARGEVLHRALDEVPVSGRGEKEITALLDRLWYRRYGRAEAIRYPGTYEDIADLSALARLNARLLGYEVDPTAAVEVGAGVLLHDSGDVFLTEREDGRGWVPPGGLGNPGERYVQTAARELEEEAGLIVSERDLRLLGVYPCIGKSGAPGISVIFHERVPDGADIILSPECTDFGWFNRDQVSELTIPFNLDQAVLDHFEGRELDVR